MSDGPSRELVDDDEPLFVSVVTKIEVNGLERVEDWIMRFEWFLRIGSRPFDTFPASLRKLADVDIDVRPPHGLSGPVDHFVCALMKVNKLIKVPLAERLRDEEAVVVADEASLINVQLLTFSSVETHFEAE